MRKFPIIVSMAGFLACGARIGGTDTPPTDGIQPDVAVPDVTYTGWDISPEAKAGAKPLKEVEFLPTTGQKPDGTEPDLTPFFPDWCEQKPINPGHDPGCLALSQQFGCKFIKNPGPVGAWLSPGISMLFCATCELTTGGDDCRCDSPAVSTIPTSDGGSLCLNVIVFESIAPEVISDHHQLLTRFDPVEDVAEALAYTFFEPDIVHAYNQGEFLQMGPDNPDSTAFSCVADKVFGTLAFAVNGAYEVQTFAVKRAEQCPRHVIERVTLKVEGDGTVTRQSAELVCTDSLDGCG